MINKIILPTADKSPEIEPFPIQDESIDSCEKCSNEKRFQDLIYIVGSKNFYLLTENACEKLNIAESKIEEAIQDNSKDIITSLSEADAIDGLIKADIEAFIPKSKKVQYENDKLWIKNARKEALKYKEKYNTFVPREGFTYVYNDKIRFIENCKSEAVTIARKKGYIYDSGTLYSPRETEIKKLLAKYFKVKKKFEIENYNSPKSQISTLQNEISSIADFYKKSNLTYNVKDAATIAERRRKNELEVKIKSYKKLVDIIEKLAFVGIATPELALGIECNIKDDFLKELASDTSINFKTKKITEQSKHSEMTATEYGQEILSIYYHYEKQEQIITKSIRDKLKSLSNATNHYAIPPQFILEEEYTILKNILLKKDKFKDYAHKAIALCKGTFFLVWDISDYKSKPMESLMLDRYPLREYLRVENAQSSNSNIADGLRHISLIHLPQSAEDRKSSIYKSRKSSDEAFFKLLSYEVVKVPIKSSWFCSKGLFLTEKLEKHLKNKNIIVNALNGDITTWKETIQRILYSQTLSNRINPFNDSYQAQLIRLISKRDYSAFVDKALTIDHQNTHRTYSGYVSKTKGSDGSKKYELGKFEMKTEFALRTGNISLVEAITGEKFICLPNNENIDTTQLIEFPYIDSNNNKKYFEYCIGAIQAKFSFDAFGFAGVNLAVSKQLELSKDGLSIPSLYEIDNKGGISSEAASLKAEAKIGAEMACYVLWHLPTTSTNDNVEAIPDYIVPSNIKAMTLIRAAIKCTIGYEAKCPIYFSMKKKKLYVSVTIPVKYSQVEIYGEVNGEALGAWVWMFQRILRKSNYHRLDIADEDSFKRLSILSQLMIYTTTNIGFYLAQKKDTLDKILDIFDFKKSGNTAYAIAFGRDDILSKWIVNMVPEALGPLINTLIQESYEINVKLSDDKTIPFNKHEVQALQQIALCKVVNFLYINAKESQIELKTTERQLEEAFYLMAPRVYPNIKEKRLLTYNIELEKIWSYLSKEVSTPKIKQREVLEMLIRKNNWKTKLNYITSRLHLDILANQERYEDVIKKHLDRTSELARGSFKSAGYLQKSTSLELIK
ncbi:hypothetical protein A3K86_02055 [Photobacterium jeanii]|uniref:Uncharacterized protein n=1 Tax=Photobacterium jeanii TaxID=858640 RepID=A0A178KKS3_9GAMM|nr:hypothetical protein [Photobacterium jeanii]OAN17726.1 hypothetical protein A3K86_02055 [Photobacterium jeanii]PST92613.1 hypothetical protein C9I91_05420 [Photobacterium jeanii]